MFSETVLTDPYQLAKRQIGKWRYHKLILYIWTNIKHIFMGNFLAISFRFDKLSDKNLNLKGWHPWGVFNEQDSSLKQSKIPHLTIIINLPYHTVKVIVDIKLDRIGSLLKKNVSDRVFRSDPIPFIGFSTFFNNC